MIQDIEPKIYRCEFEKKYPKLSDYVIYSEGKSYMMKKENGRYLFPTFADTKLADVLKDGNMTPEKWKNKIRKQYPDMGLYRTVAIDDEGYYIVDTKEIFYGEDLELAGNEILRHYQPAYMSFGVATAAQIARWQGNNKFCGRCGKKMVPSDNERAMQCQACKNIVFPKICPAVTVSIIHDDKILLVRNKGGAFHRYAQVAGYVEVGETFEDTVIREVMEETGIKVKNPQYYKNQPWGMTDAQMIGYVVETEGSTDIVIQESEIIEGRWFSADEIPPDIATRSLTYEMISNFRKKYIKKTGESGRWKKFYELFDIGE